MRLLSYILTFASLTCFGSATSNDNDRLREALKQHPKADVNKDGVLTAAEARAFRAKNQRQPTTNKKSRVKELTASGKNVAAEEAVSGYNGLYMGHSFFTPTARFLPEIIPQTKVQNHVVYSVMAGGMTGTPKMLWENDLTRKLGQDHLDKGNVDFLALTFGNSSVDDYARWFDYAIAKNPKITFMVAIQWMTELHSKTVADLDKAEDKVPALYQSLVVPLRKRYPNNKVLFCPYGIGVHELARLQMKGHLPGVKYLLNPNKKGRKESKQNNEQLVNDEKGHGSQLVTHLNALVWLQTLYDYDVMELPKQRVAGLPDVDLNEIAAAISKRIAPYNAAYHPK